MSTSVATETWQQGDAPLYATPTTYMDESGRNRRITADEHGIPRDQWGRPVIRKADGTWAGYTRISTLAKELDTGDGLKNWAAVMTAIGITRTPDLFLRVADLVDNSTDPYAEHKRELIRIAQQAQEAAGSTVKRELGTTLHGWVQRVDDTNDLDIVPDEYRADVEAYLWETAGRGVKVTASEVFVVVDELEAAGSLDSLLVMPDGRVKVGDLKTGQRDCDYPMSVEMQVAAYAHGERYDLGTGVRAPLHPGGVDLEEGVLIHAPSGSGRCTLYPLDLRRGWANLLRAKDLRAARKDSGRKLTPMTLGGVA